MLDRKKPPEIGSIVIIINKNREGNTKGHFFYRVTKLINNVSDTDLDLMFDLSDDSYGPGPWIEIRDMKTSFIGLVLVGLYDDELVEVLW